MYLLIDFFLNRPTLINPICLLILLFLINCLFDTINESIVTEWQPQSRAIDKPLKFFRLKRVQTCRDQCLSCKVVISYPA